MIAWWWALVAFVIGQVSAVVGIALATAAQSSELRDPEVIRLADYRRGITQPPERGRGA